MKAIFLKELRENAKWALLMLVGLGLLMTYQTVTQNGPPLVSYPMHGITVLGFPAAGFVLGMLQVLQDRRRGRWGFLIHRPIGRTRVFVAKVAAGILLYFGATAIPLAATVWWVATPGHVAAPFEWDMVAARAADLLGGVPWYLAGLLAAAREARWIGSRLFPAGLAFIAAVFADFALSFGEAALLYAGAVIVLLPAAWGAFVAEGEYESKAAPIRLAQGVSVAAGVLIAYMVAMGLAFGLVESLGYNTVVFSPQYAILHDGQVVRQTAAKDGTTQVTDLQGHALPLTADEISRLRLTASEIMLRETDPAKMKRSELEDLYGIQGGDAYAHVLYPTEQYVQWYYVPSRQTIEGFNTVTRRLMGSIGPSGFAGADRTPESFPERFIDQLYAFNNLKIGRTTAYDVNLQMRQAKFLFTTTADDTIIGGNEWSYQGDVGSDPSKLPAQYDFIVTHSTIWVYKNANLDFKIPLEYSYPDYFSLEIGRMTNGRFLVHYQAGYAMGKPEPGDEVVQTDDRGQIVERTELPPLVLPGPNEPQWLQLTETAAVPPALLAFLVYEERDNPGQPFSWRMVAIEVMVIGCISAVAAMLLMRRYDSRRGATPLWMAICFVMGIPGLLLLISLRQVVARETCPACGRQRLISRERCEYCGMAFVEPERVGIEIFEVGVPAAQAAHG